jgi:hypothetical protein
MKFDVKTIRLLGRITDRMDLIRKHPHRYDIAPEDLTELSVAAETVERLLAKVKIITAG